MSNELFLKDAIHVLRNGIFRGAYKDANYQIEQNNALQSALKIKNRIQVDSASITGLAMQIPSVFRENQTLQNINGATRFATSNSSIMESLLYPYSEKVISISYSQREEDLNSGQGKIVDYLKVQMEAAKITCDNRENIEWWGEGTIEHSFLGVPAMVQANGLGTVGGVNAATVPTWANQYIHAGIDGTITNANIIDYFDKMNINTTLSGGVGCDLIASSNDHYLLLEKAVRGGVQYLPSTMDKGMAELGFSTLKYKGATVIHDANVNFAGSEGKTFFLKTSGLGMKIREGANWDESKPLRPHDQFVFVVSLRWLGASYALNRRQMGVIYTNTP